MTTQTELYLYEEIMLLALRDREGKTEFGSMYMYALAGALLAEMLISNRIRLVEKKKFVQLVDATPFGDELLDECLELVRCSKRRKRAVDWVPRLLRVERLKHRAAAGLCRRGVLRHDEKKVLFVFTQHVYPEADPGPERQLIARLRDALASDLDRISPRTCALLGLASVAGLLKAALDKRELKEHKKQIKQLTEQSEIGQVTRQVVEAAQSAAAVAASTAAIG